MTIDDSALVEGSIQGSVENFESLAQRVGNTSRVAMLTAMTRDPGWTSAKTVLDATSGNMGCSIAYFGRAMGARVHIVSSSTLTAEKHGFIKYFGGSVEAVGQFTIEGNRYCSELARRRLPDTIH
jgi:cysteine synthase